VADVEKSLKQTEPEAGDILRGAQDGNANPERRRKRRAFQELSSTVHRGVTVNSSRASKVTWGILAQIKEAPGANSRKGHLMPLEEPQNASRMDRIVETDARGNVAALCGFGNQRTAFAGGRGEIWASLPGRGGSCIPGRPLVACDDRLSRRGKRSPRAAATRDHTRRGGISLNTTSANCDEDKDTAGVAACGVFILGRHSES
jgi:hypothetical protein